MVGGPAPGRGLKWPDFVSKEGHGQVLLPTVTKPLDTSNIVVLSTQAELDIQVSKHSIWDLLQDHVHSLLSAASRSRLARRVHVIAFF